jgi:hypothetical protein
MQLAIIREKEGATTIILNIDNFDISELSSKTTKIL